jgi:hypothetical protein
MPDADLKKYEYLWDGTQSGWVLLQAPHLEGGLCIFNKVGRVLLHVESAELNQGLCERLKQKGVEVLDAIPKGEVEVKPM